MRGVSGDDPEGGAGDLAAEAALKYKCCWLSAPSPKDPALQAASGKGQRQRTQPNIPLWKVHAEPLVSAPAALLLGKEKAALPVSGARPVAMPVLPTQRYNDVNPAAFVARHLAIY